MCVCVCVCVCVRVRVCVVCVCVLARIRLDLSSYSIDFNRTGLIFFAFLCDGGSKIRFLIGPMLFGFISNFRISKDLYLLFFNDRI